MNSQQTGGGSVDWNHLARDMDQRRGLLNTVMNLRASKNARNYLNTRASYEGLLHAISEAETAVYEQADQ
jgi:hypothetical protein